MHTTSSDVELKLIPVHIFTVIAYTSPPETASRIINSMSYLQRTLEEESRFDTFIKSMAMDCRELRRAWKAASASGQAITVSDRLLSVAVDGLIFINAILDNLDDYELRIHIRNQLCRRPFRAEFEALREIHEPAIVRQLDVFTALLQTDAEWLMEQYARQPKSFINARDLFEVLLESVKGTEGAATLTQFLQHVLCVRADASVRSRYIRFLDATLATVLLAGKGLDPDFCSCPVPYLSFKELDRLLNTTEVDALRQENLRLQFQMTGLQDNHQLVLEEQASSITALRAQVADLTTQLEGTRKQSKQDSEATKKELESINDALRDELLGAQGKIVQLEAQVRLAQGSFLLRERMCRLPQRMLQPWCIRMLHRQS